MTVDLSFLLGCSSVVCLKIETAILLFSPQLSNHQFEELAMDVYDEVDRRETDAGKISSNDDDDDDDDGFFFFQI